MALPSFVNTVRTTNATTATSISASLPTYSAGDLVLLYIGCANSNDNTVSITAPGWTTKQASVKCNGWTTSSRILYRIMDGTEGSSVTLTAQGGFASFTGGWDVNALSYSGADPLGPFDGSVVVTQISPSNVATSAGNISTSGNERKLVSLVQIGNGTPTWTCSTSNTTERFDVGGRAGYDLAATAPGTYSFTVTSTSSFESLAMTLAIAPPSTGLPPHDGNVVAQLHHRR